MIECLLGLAVLFGFFLLLLEQAGRVPAALAQQFNAFFQKHVKLLDGAAFPQHIPVSARRLHRLLS